MTDKAPENLADTLRQELGLADWKALSAHYKRQAVFVVSDDLDLVEVGLALANDKVDLVTLWLEDKKLAKATEEDAKKWEKENLEVSCLIIQPYVLVQKIK